MSAPDILANMARGWNKNPSGVALGTEGTSISAALWTCESPDVQEVTGEPDPTQHIVSLMLSGLVQYRLEIGIAKPERRQVVRPDEPRFRFSSGLTGKGWRIGSWEKPQVRFLARVPLAHRATSKGSDRSAA